MKYIRFITIAFIFSACTKDAAPPTGQGNGVQFQFSEAYSITQNSTNFSGEIKSGTNAPTVTNRGFCWDTVPNTVIKNFANSGSGTGVLTGGLINLLPGTKYYVRGYYKISFGTFFSNEISFKTLPATPATVTTINITNITRNSAVVYSSVSAAGGSYNVNRGICWSTSGTPTIANSFMASGTGIGSYYVTVTNLAPATTYIMQAYATNEAGTAYGGTISFKTLN